MTISKPKRICSSKAACAILATCGAVSAPSQALALCSIDTLNSYIFSGNSAIRSLPDPATASATYYEFDDPLEKIGWCIKTASSGTSGRHGYWSVGLSALRTRMDPSGIRIRSGSEQRVGAGLR
jgi:hypothetical protein